ncbi:hypothetical protein JXB41_07515 [Candidatus Woesearchaeota archaeon]|nr:hypothetical protein [Candidatus Woesearchaeota archaeon]
MKHIKFVSEAEKKKEKLYSILIYAMIIGLVITFIATYYFRVYVYGRKDSFTELYFPEPDSLPNWIKLNKEYNFSFGIRSNENSSADYRYNYGIELYNLYDEIESKYKCLSKYRDKIYLTWTNETGNFSLINKTKQFPEIEDLIVYPDYEKKLNWSQYTMQTGFSQPLGLGRVVIFFRNETDIKYFITIDEQENYTTFNGKITYRGIDLHKGNNDIMIVVLDNRIKMYLNKDIVINEKSDDLYDGSFGFYTNDAYFNIGGYTAYKESLVVVPDQDTIWPYEISRGFINKKISEIRELRSKSIPLISSSEEYNETIDCEEEPFYCGYFDLANDISFFLNETNLTKVAEKVPVVEYDVNFRMFPLNVNSSNINWTDFSIQFSHTQIQPGSKGAIILKFGNKWAVMLTRNNSYFMRPLEGGILIDEIRNPVKENQSMDFVNMTIAGNNLKLKINDKEVFIKELPADYTDSYLELFIKNTYLFIDSINIKNLDKDCGDPLNFKFCELILEVAGSGSRSSRQSEEFRVDYTQYETDASGFNLFQYAQEEKEETFYDYISGNYSLFEDDPLMPVIDIIIKKKELNETVSEPLKYKIDIPVENPFIPDKRIVFNSLSSVVVNSSNFSISYGINSYDGARVEEIGLLDFYDNEILSMYVLEKQDRIIVLYYDGSDYMTETISHTINESKSHMLGLDVIKGNVMFIFDNRKIYELANTGIDSGQFFVGSRNTHLEMGDVHVDIRDKGISKTFGVNEDPCELRLIQRWEFVDNLRLEPSESINITGKFNVSHDFDYGKIFVELYGSGGMPEDKPLEIHYWVMRDDT